ncbi:stage V sporulation protein S [Aneurinibacillus soli]|uniref:Stage V sporulation protein S n=1 Tax=Aneurinibacillus soli TaxID=1500254 RepID=A0A0U5BDC3_9BACL|nr:stage V sporulation protein S [Aneurinibacillus soli]PYE62969.1 stage V sporulation protein S [Aneurinibacillus soli]BAU28972.1 Stage V sporulation protein S [Aneurinibacillus soli]
MKVIKVTATASVNNTARAIAQALREHGEADVQAVGATAVNQMVKSIASSRHILARTGFDLTGAPDFFQLNEKMSAVKMIVKRVSK